MTTTSDLDADTGYGLGFTSLEEEVVLDSLPVTGELPAWLSGSLLRTGPAKFEVGDTPMRHWFDGLAMLHRYTFEGGRVSYGNRFLGGRTERAVRQDGVIAFREFATDPCRSIFKRVQTLFAPEFGDNANVNVVRLGERFLSMTETPIAVEFDPRTLESVGVPFVPPGQVTTAHPHTDRADGSMINLAVKMGPRSSYRFYRVAETGTEPELLASIPVREPGYLHSFGLSERYLVLVEFPWVLNPAALLLSGRPYAENYRWEPERGTRFLLVDRQTGAVSDPITTGAFFAFHHVNADDDDGGEVVVDLTTYADAGIVDDLYLDRLRAGRPLRVSTLTRFRLDPSARTARRETLVEEPMELAQISYAAHNERPYRYAWGVGNRAGAGFFDQIVRADVVDRSTTTWHEEGCYPGEPVFVARPESDVEDDGVLLSVVLDARRGTSFLLALDAADLRELARAAVPHHVPFSFHGRFAASVT